MKSVKYLLLAFIISVAYSFNATAQDRGSGLGAGIILGEPTGLSAQKWMSDRSALAAAAAWSFSGSNVLHIHVDYQLHNYDLITVEQGIMSFYWGIGGRIVLREGDRDSILGARVPLGLNYHIEGSRLAAFVEAVPKINLIPSTGFDVGAGLGIRYFF